MADKFRIVFMGSPEFAVPTLEALLADENVVAVVTQPDKPAGRGLELRPPAVKLVAERAGVPVWQPASVRKPPFLDELRALNADLAVVVAFGRILPQDVLDTPRFGCWNVHGSLLPKYRGAAPIQWSVIHGERETGATLMQMDAGLDTGPTMLMRSLPIPETMTTGDLYTALAPLGAELVREGLARLRAGTLEKTPQDNAHATLAPMLEKDIGVVDWRKPSRVVRDLVRGCDPWPTATTTLGGALLKLFRPRIVDGVGGTPGTVKSAGKEGLVVWCSDGAVAFDEVQLAGKKRMPVAALVAGKPIAPGTPLGS